MITGNIFFPGTLKCTEAAELNWRRRSAGKGRGLEVDPDPMTVRREVRWEAAEWEEMLKVWF